MLSKAAVVKSELEAELTKSRCDTVNVQDDLHKVKLTSDGLTQDKIDLSKIITQVHHFLTSVAHLAVVCKRVTVL